MDSNWPKSMVGCDFNCSTRYHLEQSNKKNRSLDSAVKHRQAGSIVTDSAAMRCAAGERALFTSNAECGTARQLRREMEVVQDGTGWGSANKTRGNE